ncbi:hypothetical protein ACU4GD_32215 [Cupriavidus basilensis]
MTPQTVGSETEMKNNLKPGAATTSSSLIVDRPWVHHRLPRRDAAASTPLRS